jgi:hypothetical protein
VSASHPPTGDELANLRARARAMDRGAVGYLPNLIESADVLRLVAEVERLRAQVEHTYQDGIHRGRRVVPDPERFPAPWPDYAMRTAQGHPPIPEQYRWKP